MRPPRLLTILLLLLAGAVVNVSVAWGCAVLTVSSGGWTNVPSADKKRRVWDKYADEKWLAASFIDGGRIGTVGWDCTCVFTLDAPPMTPRASKNAGSNFVVVASSGWPLRSMEMHATYDPGNTLRSIAGAWPLPEPLRFDPKVKWAFARDGGYTFLGPGCHGALPCIPRWPAFAVNTFFYAALLWLVFFGPHTLGRHVRTRRGLCPACKYPVGESSVCSECGKAVKPRAHPDSVG